MYNLVSITKNYEDYFQIIYDFCKKAVSETKLKKTIRNMDYRDWENNPHCLLYRLYKKRMFDNDNGMFNLLYYNDELIALCGVERAEMDPSHIAILAKRMFVIRKFRNKGVYHDHMFDTQVEWAKERGIKVCLITVNEYQRKTLVAIFKKIKSRAWGRHNSGEWEKYKDLEIVPTRMKINKTFQYIICHFIDKSFREPFYKSYAVLNAEKENND